MRSFIEVKKTDYDNSATIKDFIERINKLLNDTCNELLKNTYEASEKLKEIRNMYVANYIRDGHYSLGKSEIIQLVEIYYLELASFVRGSRIFKKDMVDEASKAILLELDKNLPEVVFILRPKDFPEDQFKKLLAKMRHHAISRVYISLAGNATDSNNLNIEVAIKILVDYSCYLKTITDQDVLNDTECKKCYRMIASNLSGDPGLNNLVTEDLQNIFQTPQGEENLMVAFDFLKQELFAKKDARDLRYLGLTYLNWYVITCENKKENLDFPEIIYECLNFVIQAHSDNVALSEDYYLEYYTKLKSIILKTNDSQIQKNMAEKLFKPKNDVEPKIEESRITMLRNVCNELLNEASLSTDVRSILQEGLAQLNPSSVNTILPQETVTNTSLLQENHLSENIRQEGTGEAKEEVDENKNQKEQITEEMGNCASHGNERKETDKTDASLRAPKLQETEQEKLKEEAKTKEALEAEEEALKQRDDKNVRGGLYIIIKDKLLCSAEFTQLQGYGNTHKIKKNQIGKYTNQLNAASNLAELFTAVKADTRTPPDQYSVRDNTAILGVYSWFHQGKSTTDTLARNLEAKLQEIVQSEMQKLGVSQNAVNLKD